MALIEDLGFVDFMDKDSSSICWPGTEDFCFSDKTDQLFEGLPVENTVQPMALENNEMEGIDSTDLLNFIDGNSEWHLPAAASSDSSDYGDFDGSSSTVSSEGLSVDIADMMSPSDTMSLSPHETVMSPQSAVWSVDSGIETVSFKDLEIPYSEQPQKLEITQPQIAVKPDPAPTSFNVVDIAQSKCEPLLSKLITVASNAAQPLLIPLSALKGIKFINSSATPIVKAAQQPIHIQKKVTTSTPTTARVKAKSAKNASKYPPVVLTAEERRIARKENISFPSHYPLTRDEERDLKRIKRKIRNKISAQDSRKRKKTYMDGLEDRVKKCTSENSLLQQRVNQLEKQNAGLTTQLKRLQQHLATSNSTAQSSTAMFILLLSFMLILLPNLRTDSKGNAIMPKNPAQQVPGRTLLSKTPWSLSNTCEISDLPEEENLTDESMDTSAPSPAAAAATPVFMGDHDYFPAPERVKLEKEGKWEPDIKWDLPSPPDSFGFLGEGYKKVLGFKNGMGFIEQVDQDKSAIDKIQLDANFLGVVDDVVKNELIVDGTWDLPINEEKYNLSVIVPAPVELAG